MAAKKFYIGERVNPQLKNSYYIAYGQITKREAKDREDCHYGELWMAAYDTEAVYLKAITELQAKGRRVTGWNFEI